MAEGAPLLREYRVYSPIEGSNPSLSYCSLNRVVSLLVLLDQYHKEREMAWLSHLAKPEKNRLEKSNTF